MVSPQRLPASLTPLDTALAALLRDLAPIAPANLPLTEALGCIAADMPPLDTLTLPYREYTDEDLKNRLI